MGPGALFTGARSVCRVRFRLDRRCGEGGVVGPKLRVGGRARGRRGLRGHRRARGRADGCRGARDASPSRIGAAPGEAGNGCRSARRRELPAHRRRRGGFGRLGDGLGGESDQPSTRHSDGGEKLGRQLGLDREARTTLTPGVAALPGGGRARPSSPRLFPAPRCL